MSVFNNLQRSIYQIKNTLKGDLALRKLLYYATKDALSKTDVDYNLIDNYILVNPVFNVNKETFNKSIFLTINLVDWPEEEQDENKIFTGTLRINVMCKNTLWELDEEKIRTLAIIDRLYELLNDNKFDVSHKLNYLNSQIVVLNEEISGYMVLFDIIEGAGHEQEF